MLSIRRFWNAIWPLDRNLELGPESVCATEFSPLIYSLGLWKTWEICGKLILCADLADTLRSSWAKAKLGVLVDYAFWYSSLQQQQDNNNHFQTPETARFGDRNVAEL
jgi:hypothetical protein